jgi:hypothetical protein
MRNLIHLLFLTVLISAQSCNLGSKSSVDPDSIKTFSINYSYSQVSNYSYYITVSKSDSIRFEEKNFFWDRWQHKGDRLPRVKICALRKDELKELKRRTLKANVFNLKDSYGVFDGNEMNQYSVLHNFSININDSIKYITMRDAKDNEPSPEFINMLQYLIDLRQKYDTEYGNK